MAKQQNDLHTLVFDENERNVFVGSSSVIGKRKDQQDSVVADDCCDYLENGKMIAVLCDGMGGLAGGAKASSLCATLVYNTFHSIESFESIQQFYRVAIYRADEEVSNLKSDEGVPFVNAGTTFVSVVVEDNKLYWASVGDSRIYIVRGNEILCVTKDHNYLMLLNEMVQRGEITRSEADNNPKREALVSYIGMGGVRYIDLNKKPFDLIDGDHIILCSDGLYRSVTEDEIRQIVTRFNEETQLAAENLTALALSKNNIHQDNTSVVVLGYRDSGRHNI